MMKKVPQQVPHGALTALDPPRSFPPRRWRCRYCKTEGLMDAVMKISCPYPYPPCDGCGGRGECTRDCPLMARLLGGAVGSDPKAEKRACYLCKLPGGAGPRELRPYGKDGQDVCSGCMFGEGGKRPDPAVKREAEKQLAKRMGVAGTMVLDPGEQVGPRPTKRGSA